MPDAGSVKENQGRDVAQRQGLQVHCRERCAAAAGGDDGCVAEGVTRAAVALE